MIELTIILIAIIVIMYFYIKSLQDRLKSKGSIVFGQKIQELVPFMKNFKYNLGEIDLQFIEKPIDYVIFDKDKVVFLEIKSGSSSLSEKQKNIKNLIERGKVYWEEIRI